MRLLASDEALGFDPLGVKKTFVVQEAVSGKNLKFGVGFNFVVCLSLDFPIYKSRLNLGL